MLTTEQIIERKYYVGASEAAAVCGVDPWRTPYDVWAAKTGRVDSFQGNEATDAGHRLESAVIKWAADKLHAQEINPAVFVRHRKYEFIAANLDAVLLLPNGLEVDVDAKTGGIYSPLRHENWTADEFPEQYQVQLQLQLACDPTLSHAYLAALCPPMGFLLYRVERDEALSEAIVGRIVNFWDNHVMADEPPDGLPSLEVAKRLRRVPNKETILDTSLVAALQAAKERCKEADAEEKRAQAALLAALGDAELGRYDGGCVTYFETSRDGYEVAPTKYRTLRFKKDRK